MFKTLTISLLAGLMAVSSFNSLADNKEALLNQQAQATYQKGDYPKAAELTAQVLALQQQQVGEKHPDT